MGWGSCNSAAIVAGVFLQRQRDQLRGLRSQGLHQELDHVVKLHMFDETKLEATWGRGMSAGTGGALQTILKSCGDPWRRAESRTCIDHRDSSRGARRRLCGPFCKKTTIRVAWPPFLRTVNSRKAKRYDYGVRLCIDEQVVGNKSQYHRSRR